MREKIIFYHIIMYLIAIIISRFPKKIIKITLKNHFKLQIFDFMINLCKI